MIEWKHLEGRINRELIIWGVKYKEKTLKIKIYSEGKNIASL